MSSAKLNNKSKMYFKVAYLLNSSQIGGGNRSMLTLWRGLKGMLVKPLAFCPSSGPMIDTIKDAGLPFYIQSYFQPSWKQPIQSYLNQRLWVQFFRHNNISLVHANDLYNGRSVVLSSHYLGIPLLCHVRFPPTIGACTWAFKKLPKPVGFIFNSKALQKETGPFLRKACPKSRQWIVYNAVDLTKFQVTLDTKNAKPRIGIVANLQPVKGHEDFIHMASLLIHRGNDVVFEIIGGDIHESGREEQLKNLARDLGIANRIIFHGNIEEVYNVIQRLDIVVCTSHIEPFGRCIIEAMACGKPVVATRVGGIPEIVIDQQTGYLVPPKKPERLANTVELLINDRELRKKMGVNGRKRVEKLFSMETHAKAMINIYREFIREL